MKSVHNIFCGRATQLLQFLSDWIRRRSAGYRDPCPNSFLKIKNHLRLISYPRIQEFHEPIFHGVHLMGVHLTGVHLMGVHLMGYPAVRGLQNARISSPRSFSDYKSLWIYFTSGIRPVHDAFSRTEEEDVPFQPLRSNTTLPCSVPSSIALKTSFNLSIFSTLK
jgi:hypothetical protein